ncbi:MAG: hypothetical protein RL017_633 [Pseudomonadota bacterium]|jgi:host factor-I protein|nr:RNA chaperone Hfq [Burkholderiales bacterium]
MLKAINLQNEYLEQLQSGQKSVAIYLINGIKLSGLISAFDEYVVLLKDNKSTVDQLIYKHAISTIVPVKSSNND